MDRVFFYLLIALLPTQLGYHSWPEWSLVLGRRVDYLSPTLYLTDLLIIFILVSWMYRQRRSLGSVLRIMGKTVIHNSSTLILFLFVAVNVALAASPPAALWAWVKVAEFVLLGTYVVATRPKISSVIFYVSMGALYSSFLAFAQFILQRSVGLWILGERTFTADTPGIARFAYQSFFALRSYGTFPHPNVLGGFLAVTLPLIMQESPKKKLWYGITLVVGVLALITTFSRSAWIAFLAGAGVMNYKLWKKSKLFLPMLAIAAGVIFFVVKTMTTQDESVVVRQALNNSAVAMFLHSPLVGVGLGNFLVNLPKFLVSREIYFLQPTHNMYLLVLAQTGIVGFCFFVALLLRVMNKRSAVRIPLAALLFLGLVDHYPVTLQQGQLLLTLFLSLALIGQRT